MSCMLEYIDWWAAAIVMAVVLGTGSCLILSIAYDDCSNMVDPKKVENDYVPLETEHGNTTVGDVDITCCCDDDEEDCGVDTGGTLL